MLKKEVLAFKKGDVFYHQSNGQHKCTVLHVEIESNLFHGVLVKWWRKGKQRWHRHFFDRYELELLCTIGRLKDE